MHFNSCSRALSGAAAPDRVSLPTGRPAPSSSPCTLQTPAMHPSNPSPAPGTAHTGPGSPVPPAVQAPTPAAPRPWWRRCPAPLAQCATPATAPPASRWCTIRSSPFSSACTQRPRRATPPPSARPTTTSPPPCWCPTSRQVREGAGRARCVRPAEMQGLKRLAACSAGVLLFELALSIRPTRLCTQLVAEKRCPLGCSHTLTTHHSFPAAGHPQVRLRGQPPGCGRQGRLPLPGRRRWLLEGH